MLKRSGKLLKTMLAGCVVELGCAAVAPAEKLGDTATPEKPKIFRVLDNLGYAHKPELAPYGAINCNIIYEGHIWGDKEEVLPSERDFKNILRSHVKKAGPIVIDIEKLALKGDSGEVDAHFTLFMTLVKWTHEALPGRLMGYYGQGLFPQVTEKKYNDQAKKLAQAVDVFFPSMYTMNDDRAAWKKKLEGLIKDAHEMAPGKPVCPYLWPQYHDGTPKGLQFISGDYWSFELDTARDCGANGVVLWSGGRPDWNANADWWRATVKFLGELRAGTK